MAGKYFYYLINTGTLMSIACYHSYQSVPNQGGLTIDNIKSESTKPEVELMLNYHEVVKTIVLNPIPVKNGETLNLRIEVIKSNNTFTPQLWRVETYRISSSFGDKTTSDEECLIKDSLFFEGIVTDTIEECINKSLQHIQKKLLSV